MDNDDDFTFCQIDAPAKQDNSEEKQLASHVDDITIKDEGSDGLQTNEGLLWKDKLSDDVSSKKEMKVGSLSYNVIDSSSSKQSSGGLGRQMASRDAGTSVKNLQGQKVSAKKPASRAKVPFEQGYSQMDWLKLTRTHPDLAGLKGQSNKRLISMNEVKQHKTMEGSMWTVLKGRVYNLSPYLKFHPGGDEILMKAVGRDCTLLFNKYHAWVNDEFLLEKCLVGILDDSK